MKPDIIYYYETYSAWPVYAYLRFFNLKARLFIHNHEYFDNNWYRKGMKLVNWYHRLEVNFLYERAEWISQTNHYRNELFAKDHPLISTKKLEVLRNFPPKKWAELYANQKENNSKNDQVRVYWFPFIDEHISQGVLSMDNWAKWTGFI
jgi:hypothetical protein